MYTERQVFESAIETEAVTLNRDAVPRKLAMAREFRRLRLSDLYFIFAATVALSATLGAAIVLLIVSNPVRVSAPAAPAAPASDAVAAARPDAPANTAALAQQPGAAVAGARPAAPAPARPAAFEWTTIVADGAWKLRCPPGGAVPADRCAAVLELAVRGSKEPQIVWIVAADKNGGLNTVFHTPTGVLVGAGVELKYDTSASRQFKFLSCAARRCTAVTPMPEEFVRATAAAKKINLAIYSIDGKRRDFVIPTLGLGNILASLSKDDAGL